MTDDIDLDWHKITDIDYFLGEYRFLSNFYMIDIEVDGIKYASSEHAYQAAKFLDKVDSEKIREAKTPGKTKEIAVKLKKQGKVRKDWIDVSIPIMEKILRIKFNNPEMKKKLLATGDRKLIEGNTWNDTFWGVCKGVGHNNLGILLMKIREDLRKENGKELEGRL